MRIFTQTYATFNTYGKIIELTHWSVVHRVSQGFRRAGA